MRTLFATFSWLMLLIYYADRLRMFSTTFPPSHLSTHLYLPMLFPANSARVTSVPPMAPDPCLLKAGQRSRNYPAFFLMDKATWTMAHLIQALGGRASGTRNGWEVGIILVLRRMCLTLTRLYFLRKSTMVEFDHSFYFSSDIFDTSHESQLMHASDIDVLSPPRCLIILIHNCCQLNMDATYDKR